MEAKVAIPKERKIDWDYDEEADVLYISFGKPRPAVGIDIGKGIILRYDEREKEITGMTIVGLRGALLDSLKKYEGYKDNWERSEKKKMK